MCKRVYVYIHMHAYIYIYIYIHMCIYIYIYLYRYMYSYFVHVSSILLVTALRACQIHPCYVELCTCVSMVEW